MPNSIIKHVTIPLPDGTTMTYDLSSISLTTTGSGNGVSSVSLSSSILTVAYSEFLTSHPSVIQYTDTTSTSTPSFGDSVTVVDSVTRDTNGHVQKIDLKTITLPSLGGGTGISIGSNGYTINHSNSITAQTNYNKYKYKYDAQGHITESSHWVHTASGTNGSAGWIKIANLKIIESHINTPITLICSRRGGRTFQMTILFTNQDSIDPGMSSFELSYIPSCVGTTETEAYIVHSATSTWDLYVLKMYPDEVFVVNDFIVGKYFVDHIIWTWKDEQVAEVTSGIVATNRMSIGMKYDNGYYGMTASGFHNYWIRTTTKGIIPYESGGENNGHSSLGTTDWRFKDAYIDDIYGTTFHGTSTYANMLKHNGGGEITPVYFSGGIPLACKTYESGATWRTVPVVASDGAMDIGKYLDFHSSNTGTTNYDIRFECEDSSNIIMTSTGSSQAFTIKGTLPRFRFYQTTSGQDYSTNVLVGYPSSTNGMNLAMGAGGNVIIGSGEYHTNFYNATKANDALDYWTDTGENMYIGSDSYVMIQTNAQTIANRKSYVFANDFNLSFNSSIIFRIGNVNSYYTGSLTAGTITAARTWTLPDETGTVALVTNTDAIALINTLETGTATPADDDYYIAQYANGGTDTTIYYRRQTSALYRYMCNKRTGYMIPDGSTVSPSANNWFRIAYSTTTHAYSDVEGIFLLNCAYSNISCGILKIRGRTEGTAGIFGNTKSVQWLIKDEGFDGNSVCVIFADNKGSDSSTVNGTACVEIWVKATERYSTITCTLLNGFGRNAENMRDWTWHMINNSAYTGITTLPTYSSSTAVYATSDLTVTVYDVTYKTPTPSGKVNSQWSSSDERTRLVTKGWMSCWDGSYNGTTSNLTYCNQGAFGTIVTHAAGDYFLKTGDTVSGVISSSLSSGTYINGNNGEAIINSTASNGSYTVLAKMNSTNGKFTLATYLTNFRIQYTSNTTIGNNSNSVDHTTSFNESGEWTFPNNLHCNQSSGNAYYHAKRTDTSVEVSFGVGSGGTNHGLYSQKLGKWLVYADASDVYINNHVVPTLSGSNVSVYKVLYTSTTAPSATSGSINANSSTTVVGNYDIIKVWVYIGTTSVIQQVDICCTTLALAQAQYHFSTGTSYNTKYLYFSSNGYTLNFTTAGTSDSTKISIAKVIGVRFS